MRRRDLLIGAGSVAALGGGAAVAFDAVGTAGEDTVGSVELDAIEAPGSDAGVMRIPDPGRVTFLELFATWCSVCESMMPELAAAHESVSDDVQFVSVTNEPLGNTTTHEDVAEWWRRHNGAWPVAADRDLELSRRLDASGVPYAFVLDRRNRIVWRHRGRTSAETIRAEIRAAEA
jgi:thiol-disulfide isomerase/thioredoxin